MATGADPFAKDLRSWRKWAGHDTKPIRPDYVCPERPRPNCLRPNRLYLAMVPPSVCTDGSRGVARQGSPKAPRTGGHDPMRTTLDRPWLRRSTCLFGMATAATVLCAASAGAAGEAERTMAHEASVLAALIRSDARAAGKSSTALVTHVNGCCGIKVLVVSYLAQPGSYAKHGEYGLELVTFGGGGIEKVAVSTYKNRHAGFAKEYIESPYDFHMDPRGPKYTSPGDAYVVYNSPNFFRLHGADCSETNSAAVTELYDQALAIARQAPTRAPLREEPVLAPASCRITTP